MATSSSARAPPRSRDERNRDNAIHHATLLQQRKDTELQVLEALEELIDFPNQPTASPSDPSSSILISFRKLIASFQVSDYDALLQERNIVGSCGYVFCPRTYVKERQSLGKYDILHNGAIVEKSEVRRWCSKACARRAMFIKVQLSEVPAWERQGGLGNQIEVLKEDDELKLEEKMKSMSLGNDEDELKSAMEELALERGESKKSGKLQGILKNGIQEKGSSRTAMPPDASRQGTAGAVEGYMPHTGTSAMQDDDDDEDDDWDLT